MHDFILWMGGLFSPEAYLFWTRIQCLLWTAADVLIIVFLTRSVNLLRALCDVAQHRMPYYVVVATLAPLPFVVVVPTGMQVFLIELLVTVPHFLVILYVLLFNIGHAPRGFAKLLAAEKR